MSVAVSCVAPAQGADACCHTHRVTCAYGDEPREWSGPEPVLPVLGHGSQYCWVLVPWSEADTWVPPVGQAGGELLGPGPMAFAGLSVLSIGYVQEHTGEVNAEMAEWRRRNGWPG